ncbi:MAG: hypothetical protein CR994_01090 [Maribacter sp.]|nr:MAG: hypothetical protein CR994_01090 [Maribacter sp.]
MKKIVLSLFVIGGLISCNNDDGIEMDPQDFLVFGHYFYGMCGGEGCVEIFKLTDKKLFEGTIDDYSGEEFEFMELGNDKFEQVKDLVDFFPRQLLDEKEAVLGCPDCADAGGLFVRYSKNGNVRSWRIDQVKGNVPSYLHDFIDKVNEKIALINKD